MKNMNNLICKICSELKPRIRKKPGVFVNEKGKLWRGRNCYECSLVKRAILNRLSGKSKPIDMIKEHRISVGRSSERLAELYFKEQGWTVEITKSYGPDLVIKYGDIKLTVEVKTASKKKSSWVTGAVTKNRKNDDFVAIVMPDRSIFIDTMENHLKNSMKDGSRVITKFINSSDDRYKRVLPRKTNSGYIGVSFNKYSSKYRAYVNEGKRQYHFGYYDCPIEAAKARDKGARELYGEKQNFNFPEEK